MFPPPEENTKCLLERTIKCPRVSKDVPRWAQKCRDAQLASDGVKSHQPGSGFVTHTSGTPEGNEQGLD